MSRLSWSRIRTVARREFLTTVRRKAFLLTLIGTPAYFAFVMTVTMRAEVGERQQVMRELKAIGVVDSSGLFAGADHQITTDLPVGENQAIRSRSLPTDKLPTESFTTEIKQYPDLASADKDLRDKTISQVLVVPADYVQTGHVRRFARSSSLFSSADKRAITGWMARGLVHGRVDSLIALRVARPTENEELFTLNKVGNYELKDDKRELLDFFLPFASSMLLGLALIIGGQYLLQGVAEEKETRILESLLCTLSADELMLGKLLGLGAVGLSVVGIWVGAGLALASPLLPLLGGSMSPVLFLFALAYFLLGYLFFGSIMTGIGGVTNNMREAQQFAVWFTFANFAPFIMITSILARPNATLPTVLSLFPPTAPTAMMLRLTAPNSAVPPWQIALSLTLLALSAWLALRGAARVFRIGLLMYGKTPTLPEIMKWARSG